MTEETHFLEHADEFRIRQHGSPRLNRDGRSASKGTVESFTTQGHTDYALV